jgi:hypothetical protein
MAHRMAQKPLFVAVSAVLSGRFSVREWRKRWFVMVSLAHLMAQDGASNGANYVGGGGQE